MKIESTRLRMPVISSKIYFDACFKAHIVAFYQTGHLRLPVIASQPEHAVMVSGLAPASRRVATASLWVVY